MQTPDINFCNLGIQIEHISRGISVFGFQITFYGMAITLGMLSGAAIAFYLAKKDGEDIDAYLDFALIAIILSVIGARVYYVIFEWEYYSAHPAQILNFRGGGLAIYGGVITAVLTGIVFTRVRKVNFFRMGDNGMCGLILGQIIGRWGNFFNCECFGEYTNNLFAMQIKKSLVESNMISERLAEQMAEHPVEINGVEYIQVHPTFLYESLWNLCVLAVMLLYKKHKKADGEVLAIYFVGYGVGRFWIEALRTDQLLLPNTDIPVSQVVSVLLICLGIGLFIWRHFFCRRIETAAPEAESQLVQTAETPQEDTSGQDERKQPKSWRKK